MFSPPAYLSIGDEFDKQLTSSNLGSKGMSTGRRFVVPMKRSPHITDAVFQKPFLSLAVGEEYTSVLPGGTFRQSLKDKSGGTGNSAPPAPFKPPGRPHKSTGSGTYYGTFSESNPHRHEAELPLLNVKSGGTDDSAKKQTWSKRNMTTNPGKKGTYGYVGLSIGRAGEVQYISEPFRQNEPSGAKRISMQPPFKAAVKKGGCFDETSHGFSTVYSINKPLPPKTMKMPSPPLDVRPWRPAGALVKDITKPPEYQEDPYDLKEKLIREERQKEQGHKPWCPAGNDPYRHIYTYPTQFDPPPVE